jgi:hypothetical protein
LIWVLGQRGIEGNKTVDQLARLGSECPFIGPEPTRGIAARIAKISVKDWTKRNHKKYWDSLAGLVYAKGSYKDPLPEELGNY